MSDVVDKCQVCRSLLDEEDLFCANCGTETPAHVIDATVAGGDSAEVDSHAFKCQGCGASMSYDASARSLRCPFCGSEQLEAELGQKSLVAKQVIPMRVTRDEAESRLRQWLQSSFWRPSDLAVKAVIVKLTPVYLPYWRFSVATHTYWTADSSQLPPAARGDWMPLTGEHRGRYSALLVSASGVLAPGETQAIQPFDYNDCVSRDEFDLSDVTYEQFRVPRKYARPQAQIGFEALESQACQRYVPGRCRNMRVNVRFQGMTSEPILLPVWIMAYQYKGVVYRYLLNGQTGKSTGTAPTSYLKIGLAIAGAVIVAVVVLGCAGLILGAAR